MRQTKALPPFFPLFGQGKQSTAEYLGKELNHEHCLSHGGIVLCSWARHFTLTVVLSTQVYKWLLTNCWGNLTNCRGVTCDGLAYRLGEVEMP